MRLLLIALALGLASASVVQPPSSGNFELLILHNNDMHARFEQTSQRSGACTTADREAGRCYGGFPRVAHVVKEARRAAEAREGPPVLYLNAGDTYTGTAWFTLYKWQIAAEFINALQPDAVSLGNHEFDSGVSGLTPFIENLNCPVLCANLILNKVPELERQKNLKNSIIINVHGVNVGIIGYLTPDTKFQAIPNDVEYVDEIYALRKEVQILQDKGVNIIIALGHSGYAKDLEIAKKVEGVDLVIGGHSNTFLWNGTVPDLEVASGPYPTYQTQASGKSVPVVQAYTYTKYLGKLLLTFDSKGVLVKASGHPILLDNTVPQDPDVLRIVNRYREKTVNTSDVPIGLSLVMLDGASCMSKECNLGNLITDSIVHCYVTKYYSGEHWSDASIAMIQGGGIRTPVQKPNMPMNITSSDLLQVLPFEGSLVRIKMNGSTLLQALEHSVFRYNTIDMPGTYLQVSGLKVVYDLSKKPGSRVVEVAARCWACDIPEYRRVKSKEVYNVLLSNFLSNGGDGFWMFKGLPRTVLKESELTATQYYLKHHSPVYPAVEGRSILLESDDKSSSSVSSVSMYAILFPCILLFINVRNTLDLTIFLHKLR